MHDIRDLEKELKRRYGADGIQSNRDDLAFTAVKPHAVGDALAYLRDHWRYVHLDFITCVDLIEEGRLELVYMLRNHDAKHDLGVKTRIDRNRPVMESLHGHWAAVATYQRELREMFGIDFPGCPRVDEDFALEGWDEMPPMRRDFDTRAYSERTYFPRPGRTTSDPAEYMRTKQYPGRADL